MNRLAELQSSSENNRHTPRNGNDDNSYSVNMTYDDTSINEKALSIVEDTQNELRQISIKTMAFTNLNKNKKPSAVASSKKSANDQQLQQLDDTDRGEKQEIMDTVTSTAPRIKQNLSDLKKLITDLSKTEESKSAHSGTIKILSNQHDHLSRKFMNVLENYNTAVALDEKRLRELTIHRIKVKYTKSDGSTITDEEAVAIAGPLLESGRTDALFNISKDELAAVLQNRQDILRIERSMRDLKQIMDDLNALINDQEVVIDTVHGQVSDARTTTGHAIQELTSARGDAAAASSKYKYFIGCSCLLIILVTILIGGFASKSF